MNHAYTKPVVTYYAREEVEEMIGPVRTQYDCSCGFEAPPFVEESQSLELFIRVPENCADKDTALIRWAPSPDRAAGGAVPLDIIIPLADGTPQPGGVLCDLGPAGFFGADEEICFQVYLFTDTGGGGGGTGLDLPPGAVSCGGDPECTYIEVEE